MSLITPHGAASLTPLIATASDWLTEAESATLPSITVSSAAAATPLCWARAISLRLRAT